MRNRPTPTYDPSSVTRTGWGEDVDAEPGLRLMWLSVAMTLPLLVVAGRLIHLQGFRSEAFAVEEPTESVAIEEIPARHGRILSADGQLLAHDEERHRVHVQYRWLEEPPDERWLRDEALSRLSRADRRNKTIVEQAKTEVLKRRDELWRSLAEMTEVSPHKLTASRSRIQERVQRILSSVEERRGQSSKAATQPQFDPSADEPQQFFFQAWDVVKYELTTSPIRERFDPARIAEQTEHHLLLDDVDWQVVAAIETNPHQFPGVRTDVISRRVYPLGELAPHLIGYRTPISDEQLAQRKREFPDGDPLDYRHGDLIGQAGVEHSYESVLRGVCGQRKIFRDPHGTVLRTELIRPARSGRDVVLNVSVPLQQRVNSLLVEELRKRNDAAELQAGRLHYGACLVALDVRSGAVLAAASAPSFDLNDWLSGTNEQRLVLLDDPRRPLFSRATQATLPPGSVFKTVSAVAAIESGRIDPDRAIECRGYLDQPNKYRCYSFTHFGHGHAATDLTKALAVSCNVYFFNAARTIGPQALCDWADRFGFGRPTGIDLPAERSGRLPRPPDPETLSKIQNKTDATIEPISRTMPTNSLSEFAEPRSPWRDDSTNNDAEAESNKRTPWYPGDTLGLAIGQSRLTSTPIQIARLMAAIANDGWLVTPHVAHEIIAPPEVGSDEHKKSGHCSDRIEPPRQRITGLSAGTLAHVREGLEQVVANPHGTGFKTVRLKEVAIAGKTGTAEIGGGRPDHAWFAGYVPADNPQIAFVVVLEQAGSGGKAAGPVAQRFVQSLLDLGLLTSGSP